MNIYIYTYTVLFSLFSSIFVYFRLFWLFRETDNPPPPGAEGSDRAPKRPIPTPLLHTFRARPIWLVDAETLWELPRPRLKRVMGGLWLAC